MYWLVPFRESTTFLHPFGFHVAVVSFEGPGVFVRVRLWPFGGSPDRTMTRLARSSPPSMPRKHYCLFISSALKRYYNTNTVAPHQSRILIFRQPRMVTAYNSLHFFFDPSSLAYKKHTSHGCTQNRARSPEVFALKRTGVLAVSAIHATYRTLTVFGCPPSKT